MTTITIYDVIQQFSAALLRQERRAASQMVRVYFAGWKQVKKRIDQLQQEYDVTTAAGTAVGENWIYQWQRQQALNAQIVKELDKFASWGEKFVTENQRKAIAAALEHSEVLTILDLGGKANVVGFFNRINPQAVEAMVGINQPNSPITRLFSTLRADGMRAAQSALEQAVLLGYNPRKTAPLLRDALSISLDRALNISRTETLRAYRVAATENYKSNEHIVKGWKWVSACDARTCPACFAMHGTQHDAGEVMQTHPSCRCVEAPITYTYEELFERHGIDPSLGAQADAVPIDFKATARKYGVDPQRMRGFISGEAALQSLTENQQISVLGKTRWQAWKEGLLDVSDMAAETYSADYGGGIKVKPLRDLFSAEELELLRKIDQ